MLTPGRCSCDAAREGDLVPVGLPVDVVLAAEAVSFLCYGVNLALLVLGLRPLCAARTGVYFTLAPFVRAVVMLGDQIQRRCWLLLA